MLRFIGLETSLTLLNKAVAEEIGVKVLERGARPAIANNIIENEKLSEAHVVVISFPKRFREKLALLKLDNWIILR